jgi:hypothetical protein
MEECPHNPEHITLIEETFSECKVRCEKCGQIFTEKGWGTRGVGKAFGDGVVSFFRSLISGEIFRDITK